jgi:hypothetical protein
VTSSGVEVAGTLEWHRSAVRAGAWLPTEGGRVRLLLASGLPVDLAVDARAGQSLLSVLGLDAASSSQSFVLVSESVQRPGYALRFNLIVNGVMVVGVGGTFMLLSAVSPMLARWLILPIGLVVALVLMARLAADASCTLHVTSEGISLPDLRPPRELAWRDIARIDRIPEGVAVSSKAGPELLLTTHHAKFEDLQGDVLFAVLEAHASPRRSVF